MRIDSNQGAQPLPESSRSSGQIAAADNSRSASSSSASASILGEDQAQLSGIHVQVQALVAQVAQLPEANQEKINALRQAVVGGKYQTSPDQIAEALFSNLAVKQAA